MHLLRGLAHPGLPQAGCVATIGNFDGVHRGHRALIENLAKQGRRLNLPVVLILFEPQPREFFTQERAPSRLTRLREKLVRLAELPVDYVWLLHFDQHLAELSAEAFIQHVLLDRLHLKFLLVGDDFHFGKGRQGNFELLKQTGIRAGFEVADTESVQIDGERVSSTLIRDALEAGDMLKAAEFLGRTYSLCGRVAPGAMLGRRLGFPTANIPTRRKKTPIQGVFAVTMSGIADRPLPGVANVGLRPTVNHGHTVQLETHLFDFAGDIYGRLVEVHFHHKLRDERRFDNVEALIAQIELDVLAAREFFATIDSTLLSV